MGLGGDANSAGYGALSKPFTGADLASEPGYQFGLEQGNKALASRQANAGGYFSGAALKAASRYNQDYAGTKFNDAFNRNNISTGNQANRLNSLIGGNQTAVSQVGNAGMNYGGAVSSNLTNNANAQGAAGISQANSWGNALNSALSGYNDYNTINSLLRNLR